jgi:hypothetical protein
MTRAREPKPPSAKSGIREAIAGYRKYLGYDDTQIIEWLVECLAESWERDRRRFFGFWTWRWVQWIQQEWAWRWRLWDRKRRANS